MNYLPANQHKTLASSSSGSIPDCRSNHKLLFHYY